MQEETGGKLKVWVFGWLNPQGFEQSVKLAEALGAPAVLLWESGYVGLPPANEPLVQSMNQYSTSR